MKDTETVNHPEIPDTSNSSNYSSSSETVTLDEWLNYLMEYSYKYGKGEIPSSENPPLIIARQAKAAITKLFEQTAESAKPEHAIITDDEMGIDRARKSAANHAIDLYERNLLQALSNSGKDK